jgi:hypothetical protein
VSRRRRRRGLGRALGVPLGVALGLWLGPMPPSVGAAAATMADAERADAAGRVDAARALWTELARAGDARAAFRLGTVYDLGEGVAADPATATCWYRRAAAGGVVPAAFNVAVMIDSGRGAPRDPAAAARWYARAAARGFARAEYNLGQLYEDGEGVPPDPAMAAAWYRAAAASGLAAAAAHLTALPRPTPVGGAPAPVALAPVGLDDPGPLTEAAAAAGVPLTWAAAPQPVPVVYYVEVVATDAAPTRPAFAAATALSATLAPLPPGRYAGRVFVLAADGSHYATGAWTRFVVPPPDPAGGSLATTPPCAAGP